MESHNKNIYAAYKAVNSHSDLDELQHWKYIKRYKKPNGEWGYVYADKETHKTINSKLKEADSYNDSAKFFEERRKETNVVDKAGVRAWKMRNEAQQYNRQKAIDAENDALWLISQNSISTISKKTINRGKRFVEKLFDN